MTPLAGAQRPSHHSARSGRSGNSQGHNAGFTNPQRHSHTSRGQRTSSVITYSAVPIQSAPSPLLARARKQEAKFSGAFSFRTIQSLTQGATTHLSLSYTAMLNDGGSCGTTKSNTSSLQEGELLATTRDFWDCPLTENRTKALLASKATGQHKTPSQPPAQLEPREQEQLSGST
jgi:hypothetical protein